MPVTLAVLRARVRVLLRDPTARPDSTVITPHWSDAEILSELNASLKNRIPLVESIYEEFYKTTKTYIGITDAIAATSDEQYKLPGMESDSSAVLRHWIVMRRDDLETKPLVPKIPSEHQEPVNAQITGLFDGLYAQYPENLAPGSETVSIISGTRLRIKPAPAETSYTYKLWYKRVPTALAVDADNIDGPDSLSEVYAHDAAIALKEIVDAASASALEKKLNKIIGPLIGEGTQDQAPAIIGNPRM